VVYYIIMNASKYHLYIANYLDNSQKLLDVLPVAYDDLSERITELIVTLEKAKLYPPDDEHTITTELTSMEFFHWMQGFNILNLQMSGILSQSMALDHPKLVADITRDWYVLSVIRLPEDYSAINSGMAMKLLQSGDAMTLTTDYFTRAGMYTVLKYYLKEDTHVIAKQPTMKNMLKQQYRSGPYITPSVVDATTEETAILTKSGIDKMKIFDPTVDEVVPVDYKSRMPVVKGFSFVRYNQLINAVVMGRSREPASFPEELPSVHLTTFIEGYDIVKMINAYDRPDENLSAEFKKQTMLLIQRALRLSAKFVRDDELFMKEYLLKQMTNASRLQRSIVGLLFTDIQQIIVKDIDSIDAKRHMIKTVITTALQDNKRLVTF
jgi:hypothetical protein